VTALFVPGWGARASLYRDALPTEWQILQPPSFRATRGSIDACLDWFRGELARREGPFVLGGHSFGAALAVIAAAREWAPVERLVLVNPAGLPLSKPMAQALYDFLRQLTSGIYPLRTALESVADTLAAPVAAHTLARAIYRLDLHGELEVLRRRGVPCSVITAAGDTMTPCAQCREMARLAGGEYEELDVAGGHVWFLVEPPLMRRWLAL
jgi:pimeloyl-ACP methyl ester carboxylesterase